ncbi:glycoside hydrolase family 43 protein [Kineococcus radiotolerans]|uniref:Glycoside hydrolase family 43 n=1 Tax=Kineococcus radiotolerans (strain ATCC BAA-149 / DSM 14245 / SRS30216) TaxID=266940 RepID=A6WB18_KINRD|nr:glycoside hydrolase family 43 protein [Kineococcus radiotolerans]ABS04007.1 glycoside hydrolase family 43 [Kineococcus radiotolerans SRS30216 = ATCC BAA-149]
MHTPIIPGFYPDPSICRVGQTYYTAHSSFEYVPGVPLFSSTDLVTWTQVGNALVRSAQLTPSAGSANSGVYAPTLRHGRGKFWLVTTDVAQMTRGHFIVSAHDPAGPWSDAVFVEGALGVDPDLMWDDDGVCHLTWKSFDVRCPGIVSAVVDPEAGRLLTEPIPLWQGLGLQAPEGPHLYRIDGWWYLLLAEGGTERGHAVTMARARDLHGPWQEAPVNPVLTHRSTEHPVQNVGHADLVQRPDGSWAMVFHGVRARGQSPLFHVNGRETFIAGLEWVDGWPRIDEDAFTVPVRDHSFTDRFEAVELDRRWVAPGVAPATFTRSTPNGLHIDSQAAPAATALLAVRPRDPEWTVQVRLRVQGSCRVLVRMDADRWYGLSIDERGTEATLAIGPAVATVGRIDHPEPPTSSNSTTAAGSAVPGRGAEVTVRISARAAAGGGFGVSGEPDHLELAALEPDGVERVFGSFEGRYLSTEVAGGFTGRVVGVEVLHGSATVREFTYRTDDAASAPASPGMRYNLAVTTLHTLMDDPEAHAILQELMPDLLVHPLLHLIREVPAQSLLRGGQEVPEQLADDVLQRLQALPAG